MLKRENNTKTRNTFCGTWYLPHSRVHKSIAKLCSNFGDSAINTGQIAYFSLRMRETPIILLPVKNVTSPSCSPTPISYMMQEFWRFGHKFGPNCIFFIAHAQNGLISTSCQKSDVTVVFSDPDFIRHAGILAIREHLRQILRFSYLLWFSGPMDQKWQFLGVK